VARLSNPNADTALRQYLLEERRAFRHRMATRLADDAAWSSAAWAELSKGVDPLAAGEACQLRRFELPDTHPARVVGAVSDLLVLGADNMLRAAE
jgi:hypothetical protein